MPLRAVKKLENAKIPYANNKASTLGSVNSSLIYSPPRNNTPSKYNFSGMKIPTPMIVMIPNI